MSEQTVSLPALMSWTPPAEDAAGVELPPQAVRERAPTARIAAALAASFAVAEDMGCIVSYLLLQGYA
jgi:hypothetical protein